MVWSEAPTRIAKKYNIRYTVFKEKCRLYKIPLPTSGYWSKLKFGKEDTKEPLPEFTENNDIELCYQDENGNYFETEFQKIKKTKASEIDKEVDTKSKAEESFIEIARRNILKEKPSRGRYPGTVWPPTNTLRIIVTQKNLERSLKIMDSFIKELQSRDHSIKVEGSNTIVTVNDIEMEFELREKFKTVPSNESYSSIEYIPSGKLCLKRNGFYSERKEWVDSSSILLEDKILRIVDYLEDKAEKEKAENAENEAWHRQYENEKRIEENRKKQREKEFDKFLQLVQETYRWNLSQLINSYINSVEAKLRNNEDNEWIEWAKEKSAWINPVSNIEDRILGKFSKEFLQAIFEPKQENKPYYNYGFQNDYFPNKKWYQ